MKAFLEIGKAVTTHGLLGELKIYPWCDTAEDLCRLRRLYLDASGTKPLDIARARAHKNMALVQFSGIESVETARKLIDTVFYAARADLTLDDGAFFIADVIGLRAVDADDPAILFGTVTDYTENGAHGVFHLQKPDGAAAMVPNVAEMVRAVDVAGGKVLMKPIKGLLDDAD